MIARSCRSRSLPDDGDRFFCWTEENPTRKHGIRLLEALKQRFGDELVVFLDRAGYFWARGLWEHVSGRRVTELSPTVSVACLRGDDLDVWYNSVCCYRGDSLLEPVQQPYCRSRFSLIESRVERLSNCCQGCPKQPELVLQEAAGFLPASIRHKGAPRGMRSVGQRGETPPELDGDALRTALADYRLSLVVLVGSYATGSAQPLSELDISVRFEDTVPRARRQGLLDEVAVAIQLATGIDAGDLVDLKTVSPAVGYEALARGMRLIDDRAEATAPWT